MTAEPSGLVEALQQERLRHLQTAYIHSPAYLQMVMQHTQSLIDIAAEYEARWQLERTKWERKEREGT